MRASISILQVLKKTAQTGEKITGPALAGELGITRAAIWKKISRLRLEGYKIEAGRSGYRLIESPDLSAEELELLLPGRKIIYKKELSSTNDLALSICVNSALHGITDPRGVIIVADSQSGGKGRLGRKWLSPPGVNIYLSVILKTGLSPESAPLLPLAAGLASALALKAQTGLDVRLKWPNDLLAGGKKLGGILLELRSDPDRILFAVVGIGINVNTRKKDFPKALAHTATSILAETKTPANRAALIAAVVKELEHWARRLEEEKGKSALLTAYRSLAETLGREIRIHTEGKTYEGVATGVDHEGRLIMRSGAKTMHFSTGDVLMVRERKKPA